MTLYGIKTCDSVRKAIKYLKNSNIEYTFSDLRDTPPKCSQIKSWLEQVELNKLFNSRGTTYRKLELKKMNLTDEQKVEWLCKDSMLIKRPVLEFNGKTICGFDEKIWDEELV